MLHPADFERRIGSFGIGELGFLNNLIRYLTINLQNNFCQLNGFFLKMVVRN